MAIVTDAPPVHGDAIPLFIDEIRALVRDEFDVRFPGDKRLNGGAAVADVALQEMPNRDGASRVHNLNSLASHDNVERDLKVLLDLTGAHRVAVLVDALYLEAIPRLTVRARALEAGLGIQVDVVPVTDDIDATLARIPPEAEAVYLTYTPLPTAAVRRRIEGINARRLPSFSMRGRAEVEPGVMAGMAAEREHAPLARRVALHVQRVLLGEDPGTLPVAFAQQRRLVVNMATVRAIDRWPPWQAVIGADLLHAEADTARVLSLGNAVREAVDANLQAVRAADRASVRLDIAQAAATAQKDLFAAQARRREAEVAMNRVPHRPLAEPFGTALDVIDRIRIEIDENGLDPRDAVLAAARTRLRPILPTTATTIGGLVPPWLGGGPMWEPMAIGIIFGLAFATALTLGLVPVLYSLFFRVSYKGYGAAPEG